MSLSFCPFFYVLVSLYMYVLSQLYPQSYLICICSLLSAFMSIIGKSGNGLGVRVEASLPRGQWFVSPLEQIVLKTWAINSILRNRNMIGKIPTWWENSDRRNRKTVGKNSAMVGNFPQWKKKSLPLHGSLSTAAPVLYAGFTYPFSLMSNVYKVRSTILKPPL
jgi:hypothetical protein